MTGAATEETAAEQPVAADEAAAANMAAAEAFGEAVETDTDMTPAIEYDQSLVGRRVVATVFDEISNGEVVCAATIVDYNPSLDEPFFFHYDDGGTDEVTLPHESIEIEGTERHRQQLSCLCATCKSIYPRGRMLPIVRRRRR